MKSAAVEVTIAPMTTSLESGASTKASTTTTVLTTTTTIPATTTTQSPSQVAAAGVDSPGATISTLPSVSVAFGIVTQNPSLTPGAKSASVSQDNVQSTICVSGYSASVRNVSDTTKSKVFAEYGISAPPSGAYEVDHLIPLELGGSNDILNLWPEPYTGADNAHDKDTWENKLHAQVCAGSLSLATAQDEIIHWWVLLGAVAPPTTTPPPVILPPVTSPPVTQPPTPNAPAGATAICRDGTYSYSQNHSGTCSHHGGVRQWL